MPARGPAADARTKFSSPSKPSALTTSNLSWLVGAFIVLPRFRPSISSCGSVHAKRYADEKEFEYAFLGEKSLMSSSTARTNLPNL